MDVVSSLLSETALAVFCMLVIYYLNLWDGVVKGSRSYSIVSEKDIELSQMDVDDDIDDVVEAYDPDQLAEQRTLE